METGLKLFALEKIKKAEPELSFDEKLLEDIRNVCRSIDSAYARFEYEQDDDLVEASIYELEALKARYRYLLRLAKEQKVESTDFSAIWGAQMKGKV